MGPTSMLSSLAAEPVAAPWRAIWPPVASRFWCWSVATGCPRNLRIGMPRRCFRKAVTSPKTYGMTSMASRFSPVAITSWVGQRRCMARPTSACANRILSSYNTSTASHRPGPCATAISSPITSGPRRCITCMARGGKIPPSPPAVVPIPIRRWPMSPASRSWWMICDWPDCIPSMPLPG